MKTVEVEPVTSGELLIVEHDSYSHLVFCNFLFALSTLTSARFGLFDFEVLVQIPNITMLMDWLLKLLHDAKPELDKRFIINTNALSSFYPHINYSTLLI